ncbi:MAG: arginine--tRNA ligase [Candidatus Pacebacteria bacterium]|jgi:arginyl-tRNA synthetase|nr:arginine--tRNA ligase [Candidatus Paceibacterota bacterium]MDP7159003.1 arginine--tRNA ligase [Candidatus Paceibacterota bacterium]MDP7366561.1 arginine--tRNA ligase [Candidatus Paceibacterota bacterium]MDP7466423.1 arginine--tRNA ligase [Candidatus Paceibacterota bacterium]MDP7648387.1 arginine--tRNA ligase [Candidatus Paceibacterota bacterium]|tara:strand:- start:16761 stop:18410 length:1650 start_codon:yes stop_codon:yes gene_type:complete
MIREQLKKAIKEAVSALSLETSEIHLEHPVDLTHGDYSTNVAMTLAKEVNKNPKELAQEIIDNLKEDKLIEKIEVAGNGFINFYLSKEFFAENLNEIIKTKDKWGSNNSLKDEKTIVEYTDPNPFKEFHIGHLMSNAIGESISRIVEFSGAEVMHANYQGDVGLHVAKAIFGKQKNPELQWGKAYAYGAQNYEDHEEEIKEINKKIYNKNDEEINNLYEDGRKSSLEHFEEIYGKLGTKFDEYFFESEASPIGKKLVEENVGKIFEESDGAVIFRGENFGLHTRVFLNSDKLPTYEAKDLALAKIKTERYGYDKSIVITANEQKEYYKVVLEAMKQIFPEFAKKTKHITHGLLRLPSGKMASRTGDVITAESLIDEVKERVLEKMKDSDITDMDKVAEKIAVGAIKYSILKQSAGKDIIFDMDKSLSFEGDSGPYLQYAHTRANAVLEKAKKENIKPSTKIPRSNLGSDLEKLLYRFPEIVERANKEFEPHYITTYLTELAGAFNSFYAKEKIVEENDTAPYKVVLTEAFTNTIKNGLWLLGIKAPERM